MALASPKACTGGSGRLVPALRPSEECGLVPSEVCTMNYDKKKVVRKPLRTEWCLEREEDV